MPADLSLLGPKAMMQPVLPLLENQQQTGAVYSATQWIHESLQRRVPGEQVDGVRGRPRCQCDAEQNQAESPVYGLLLSNHLLPPAILTKTVFDFFDLIELDSFRLTSRYILLITGEGNYCEGKLL